MYIAKNNDLIVLAKETREELEAALQILEYTSIEETDINYISHNGQYITEEEFAQQEKERIAMLKLTRGDVFRGLLQAKGITRDYIRDMINQLPDETTEEKFIKEMASIDFEEALDFYRGNQLINTIGFQLGITSEQLDRFFETNDYTVLLVKENEELPTNETVLPDEPAEQVTEQE